jgi:segregation and condensation protein A
MEADVFVDRAESAAELARREVRLEKFSGPLDLLLYLIRRDEVDITDIPIARITQQYLEYLEILRALDLEVAGEYILMAATLIRIKAQMLLPRPDEEPEEEDPRGRLVAALLEYQQFKEASGVLHGYESDHRRSFAHPGQMPPRRVEETLKHDATVFDLVTVMGELLKRSREDPYHQVTTDPYSVEDQIVVVEARLALGSSFLLSDLLGTQPSRGLVIVTFLALLELTRLHIISIEQVARFRDIRIHRRELQPASSLEGGA